MIDLSLFSDTCAYCYNGIKEGITLCNCGISLCREHENLHFAKMDCQSVCSLSLDNDEKVKVSASFDTGDLEERINIKMKNGMPSSSSSKECTHIYHCKNIEKTIESDQIKCDHCDVNENIWICLECGHMGCGREQEGIVGNGHAMKHFKECGHGQSILASSIVSGCGDTFCYVCDDFIQNPLSLLIEIKNNEVKTFEDLSGVKELPCIKSDIIGITNEGLTCYISSVLHMLCEILKDFDLSDHFMICDSNPMNCICCQLIKIFNESLKVHDVIRSIRIVGFLRCFFNDHPEFSMKKQEDCSEFLYTILEALKNYESCMLFPPVSQSFEYSITEIMKCTECKINKKDVFKSNILYLSFNNSLNESFKKYFESTSVLCKCGGALIRNTFFDHIPKYLIASLGRYKPENGSYIKIEDAIKVDDFSISCGEVGSSSIFNLSVKSAVVHKGKETTSGHYTWWLKDKGQSFLVNDETITLSDDNYPEEANLFLLASTRNKTI